MANTLNHHPHADPKDVFGFWIYIMSDCILFGAIFATYVVLEHNTFGGPGAREIASLHYIFIETMLLLISSFTYGMAMQFVHIGNKSLVQLFLAITFLLGLGFVCMEVNEFHHLIAEGNGPWRSGFLSGFFTLVGTHGLHVTMGLIWMASMLIQVYVKGIDNPITVEKLTCLGLFWHFLDIVWIFVFTIVYLMGAI